MSSASSPLQAANLLRLGWKVVELRHLAEVAWTSTDLDGADAWWPFVRAQMEFLRLLVGTPATTESSADGLPDSCEAAAQQLVQSLANAAELHDTEIAHARHQLAEALGQAQHWLRRAWKGRMRITPLLQIPEPEPDEYSRSFERRRRILTNGPRVPRPLGLLLDAIGEFTALLPVVDRAAFTLGMTLAAATHATFTGPEHLQSPREQEQSWKELVLLPRVRQAFDSLSKEFLLDVCFDEQRLIRAGTPWMTLYYDLLKELDPQSADDKPYLGIELDRNARMLRRPEYEDITLSELPWMLVRIMLAAGQQFSTPERLYRAWGGVPPSQQSLEKQLSRLRKELKMVGVGIQNQQGDGWRLVDNSTTAAS